MNILYSHAQRRTGKIPAKLLFGGVRRKEVLGNEGRESHSFVSYIFLY